MSCPKPTRLTLTADGPVDLLNLIGEADDFLATFVQGDARGSRLVIPDTAPPMTPGVRMFGGVRNESFEDDPGYAPLVFRGGPPPAGGLGDDRCARVALHQPGSYPFYTMPKSGWIEILGNGEQLLSGFQYTSDSSGVETLFALPVGSVEKDRAPCSRAGLLENHG